MHVVEKSPNRVVLAHRWHTGLGGVVLLILLVCFFLALDSKHPKAQLQCTRHPVLGAQLGDTEDIDCDLLVRPPRGPLDMLNLHKEVESSFELNGVHLAHVHPLISCTLVCDQQTEYKCRCENEEAGPVSAIVADEVVVHAPAGADRLTLVLEDNEGRGHVYYAFSRAAEAQAAYADVDAFLRRARGQSVKHSTPAVESMDNEEQTDDASVRLVLSVAHDSSWLDEAASLVFALLTLCLMLQPMFERVTLDAAAGVRILAIYLLHSAEG